MPQLVAVWLLFAVLSCACNAMSPQPASDLPHALSRSQLYEMVSNTPLSKLAPNLEISVFALTALCKKHNIPYPGSGYWTKKSLGIEQTLEPLPDPSDSNEAVISIEPSKPSRRRGGADQSVVRNKDPNATPTVDAKVSTRPDKLHPVVARWMADRECRRRDALASRNEWQISSAPPPMAEIDHRRYNILSSLFRALESKGGGISDGEKGLVRVTIDGEKIEFQVREKNRQVRLPPTDKRSSYLSQELVGTGKLVFAIKTYLRGPHNEEWNESDRNPLENQLPKIVERLFEGAAILKAWHIEQEQDRLRRQEEAERRAERARMAEEERLRHDELRKLAQDLRRANEIRAFIAAMKSQPFDAEAVLHGKSLGQWLAWAEAAADSLDKSRDGPSGVFSIVGSLRAQPQSPWRNS